MTHRPDTQAVHAGREDFVSLGVHASPIDLSSTYPVPDLDEGVASIDALAAGDATAANPIYVRLYNPTVARYESALASLEGVDAAIAFGSGMAAVTAILMAAKIKCPDKSNLVAVRPLYGGTDHLLASGLTGWDVKWATPETVSELVDEQTALVWVETPANPTLQLIDIAAVCQAAGDVAVVVDNTFATPILQTPAKLGAAMVMHSGTKYLGGHGDVLSGLVACNEDWAAPIRQVRILTGAVLHPLGAFLLHRAMPTLPLRVRKAQENAIELVQFLDKHPAVREVFFPGHGDNDPTGLVGTQMSGPGSILAFEVGSYEVAAKVLAKVKVFTSAVSLGATDSLIQHPAGLTHRIVSEEARKGAGITDGLMRISVGIEDVADLMDDLTQALS